MEPVKRALVPWGVAFVVIGVLISAAFAIELELGLRPIAVASLLGATIVLHDLRGRRTKRPILTTSCRALTAVTALVGLDGLAHHGNVGASVAGPVVIGALFVATKSRSSLDLREPRTPSSGALRAWVWPVGIALAPVAFLLLHYWTLMTLAAAAAIGLAILAAMRVCESHELAGDTEHATKAQSRYGFGASGRGVATAGAVGATTAAVPAPIFATKVSKALASAKSLPVVGSA
jgi:hypothetical protein